MKPIAMIAALIWFHLAGLGSCLALPVDSAIDLPVAAARLASATGATQRMLVVGTSDNPIVIELGKAYRTYRIPKLSKANVSPKKYSIMVIDSKSITPSQVAKSKLVRRFLENGRIVLVLSPFVMMAEEGDSMGSVGYDVLMDHRSAFAKALNLGVITKADTPAFAVFRTVGNPVNPDMPVVVDYPIAYAQAKRASVSSFSTKGLTRQIIADSTAQWIAAIAENYQGYVTTEQDVASYGGDDPPVPPKYNAQSVLSQPVISPFTLEATLLGAYKVNKITNWEYDCSNASGHWTLNTEPKPDLGYEKSVFQGEVKTTWVWMRTSANDEFPNSHQMIMSSALTLKPRVQQFNRYSNDDTHKLRFQAAGTGVHRDVDYYRYPYLVSGFSMGIEYAATVLGTTRDTLKVDSETIVPKTLIHDTEFQTGNTHIKTVGSSWHVEGSVEGGKSEKEGWHAGAKVSGGYTSYNSETWRWNSSQSYTRKDWEGGPQAIGTEPWDDQYLKSADHKWYFRYYGNEAYPYSLRDTSTDYRLDTRESVVTMGELESAANTFLKINENQKAVLTFYTQQVWRTPANKLLDRQKVTVSSQYMGQIGAVFPEGYLETECYAFKPDIHLYFDSISDRKVLFKPISPITIPYELDFTDLRLHPAPAPKIDIFDYKISKKDNLYYYVTVKAKATPELKSAEKFLTHVVVLPTTTQGYTPPPAAIRINVPEITVAPTNTESQPVTITFEAQNMGPGNPYTAALVLYQLNNGQGADIGIAISGE